MHAKDVLGKLTLAVSLLLIGCHTTKVGDTSSKDTLSNELTTPMPVVMDYGNGWFHTANGNETVSEIAKLYERDPKLVADINRLAITAKPASAQKLYIPPYNNRERVRELMTRLQKTPELVPQTPWTKEMAAAQAANKTVTPVLHMEMPKSTTINKSTVDQRVEQKISEIKLADAKKIPSKTTKYELIVATDDVEEIDRYETQPNDFEDKVNKLDEKLASVSSNSSAETTRNIGSSKQNSKAPRFSWPIKGEVVTPFHGGWKQACHGIEITAPEGSSVRASRAGKVLFARTFLNYGNLIVLDHGDGYLTSYGYLDKINISVNDKVKENAIIGVIGRPTARSQPRLFFQIRQGLPVDPLDYLK